MYLQVELIFLNFLKDKSNEQCVHLIEYSDQVSVISNSLDFLINILVEAITKKLKSSFNTKIMTKHCLMRNIGTTVVLISLSKTVHFIRKLPNTKYLIVNKTNFPIAYFLMHPN